MTPCRGTVLCLFLSACTYTYTQTRKDRAAQPATSTLAPLALSCELKNDAAQAWKKQPDVLSLPPHHTIPYSQSDGLAVRFPAGELAGLTRLLALASHIACYRQRRRVRFADGAVLAGARTAWQGLNAI